MPSKDKRNQNGFTLIELMVVVAIISILATLALPKFEQFQQKARLTEAVEMVSSLKEGLLLFRLENQTSPIQSRSILGTTNINNIGLLVQIPEESYFEYFIATSSSSHVPGSADNLRVGARHPAGVISSATESLSVNSNENGVQFYKLEGSTTQTPY